MPRSEKQEELAHFFDGNHPTLSDYGFEILTGGVVWNRDKRRRFKSHKKSPKGRYLYPLIWSDCISLNGIFDFHRAARRVNLGMFVETPDNSSDVLRKPGIVVKRTSNGSQSRRLYTAPIPSRFVKEYNGYLGENHVYIIVPTKRTNCTLAKLSRILNSATVDSVYRCMSGSSAVSKYELDRLPIPDLDLMSDKSITGPKLETSIRYGYGLRD